MIRTFSFFLFLGPKQSDSLNGDMQTNGTIKSLNDKMNKIWVIKKVLNVLNYTPNIKEIIY